MGNVLDKCLMEQPTDGRVKLGKHNVIPTYFKQNQAEALALNKTVIGSVLDRLLGYNNIESLIEYYDCLASR